MFTLLRLVVFIFLISFVFGENIQVNQCPGNENLCLLEEIRVTPCPQGKNNKPCIFKRGNNASIEFDFIPSFNASHVSVQAYSATFFADLPLAGMDTDGCHFTQCPIKAAESYNLSYNLYLSPYFPAATYTVKWWLWDSLDNSLRNTRGCCFTFKIRLL